MQVLYKHKGLIQVILVPHGRWGCTARAGASAEHSCTGWSCFHEHWPSCFWQPAAVTPSRHWGESSPLSWPGKGDRCFQKTIYPTLDGINYSSAFTYHSGSTDENTSCRLQIIPKIFCANVKIICADIGKNKDYQIWQYQKWIGNTSWSGFSEQPFSTAALIIQELSSV